MNVNNDVHYLPHLEDKRAGIIHGGQDPIIKSAGWRIPLPATTLTIGCDEEFQLQNPWKGKGQRPRGNVCMIRMLLVELDASLEFFLKGGDVSNVLVCGQ